MVKNDGYIGSRIRQYRMLAGLTQKELAQRCGISEPAIRNYELGNRLPDSETLKTIASALEINYYALTQPDPSTVSGALHMLFLLESMYGLSPEIENEEIRLVFKNRPIYTVPYITEDTVDDFKRLIKNWSCTRDELIGKEFSDDTPKKNLLKYLIWTSKYPEFPEEIRTFREAHPEIYKEPNYGPLYQKLIE